MVRVAVTVSGPTGSGKSRVAMEIEVALKAIGVKVEWCDAAQEREARLEAWAEGKGAYQPGFPDVVLQEINTPIGIFEGYERVRTALEPKTTLCSVCRQPQFETIHGTTCCNGHGGADPL